MFPVFSNKLWLTFDAESLINPPLALRLYPLCVHYISSSLKLHKVLPNAENVIYLKKRKIDTTKREVIAKKETLFSIGKPKTYVFFKA